MKIRIETTHSEPKYSHTAEVQVNYEDLNIHEVWQDLIVPALIAFGFHQTSIDEINQA